MKVYNPQINVDLSYQNCGSAWLIILRGSTEHINQAFNGFFNLCATNGELEYHDHLQTICSFWSSEEKMKGFFTRQYNNMAPENALAWAEKNILELRNNHEVFWNFMNRPDIDTYSIGKTTAEAPDADMKDSILENAYKDKSETH